MKLKQIYSKYLTKGKHIKINCIVRQYGKINIPKTVTLYKKVSFTLPTLVNMN